MWAYLPKYLVHVDRSEITPYKDFKVILGLFLPTIAVQIYQYLDKIMIGIFTEGNTENGYYEQAMRITKMVLVLVTSMSTVMVPRIGRYFKEGDKEKIKKSMYQAYRFAWFLGIPLMFGLAGIADNFIPWFYGAGYERVNNLLKIVSVITVAISINNVTGIEYLVPTKREKLYTKTVLFGTVVNFCLNLVLIPRFYAYGAAIASVIAESVIAITQLVYIRREISITKVLSYACKYLVAGIVMYMLLGLESVYLMPTIGATFVMIVSGAACYFALLLLLKDEFFIENMHTVLRKIRRK